MTYGHQRLDSPKKKNRISLLEVLAVLYIMHSLLPVVGHYMPGIIYLGLFGLTFLFALPAFHRKGAYIMLGFFAVSLLTFIIKLNNFSGAAIYLYGELQIYLYGLIALVIIGYDDPKRSRRMFWLILAMYAITAVTTIIGNDKYPQASRFLATDTLDEFQRRLYLEANIGSFSLAYALVLLTPLVIYLLRSKKVSFVIGVGLLVLFGATLIAMEYAMALLLFVASLLLLLIPKLNTKKMLITLVILAVSVLLFGGLVADLFENLSTSIESHALSERFLAVAQVLRGENEISVNTVQNRSEFYNKSIQTFLNSTLMGAWGNQKVGSIGGHSFVVDALGNFGLLGALAVIVVLIAMYQIALKPSKKQDSYPYLLWIYLVTAVLMVMNPKIYGFVFLLVMPLFGHAFNTDERSVAA